MFNSIFLQPENCLSSYDPHGFLVIYSSADRSSFIVAERVLQALWTSENIAQKAVILVGNKADLARSRNVTSEGKTIKNCSSYILRDFHSRHLGVSPEKHSQPDPQKQSEEVENP